ncbi:reverse transcriptase domain-containing protein [Tanacetum coccineum]
MSTCSFARRLLSPIEDPERLLSRRNRSEPSLLFDLEEDDGGVTSGTNRWCRGCNCCTPHSSQLKIGLLNLVTAIAFHGFENDDPHSHILRFTKITQTIKLNNVPSDVVKLLLFPFSLEGAAWTWIEKEPPNSITTWNDLVSKFVNRFFPPYKTTNLRNEITRFQQRFAGGNFLTKNTQEDFTIIENKSKVKTSRNKPQVASSSGSSTQDAHITLPLSK